MKIVVLGAGTSIPAKDRSPSGLYVQAGAEQLLFDAGPGTLHRFHAAGGSFLRLRRIFLTHYHVDHCLELATILFALRIPHPKRTRPLAIYGPPGLRRLYHALNTAFHRWLEPRTYRLSFHELGETTIRLPSCAVTARRMRHSADARGYRLQAHGRRVVYSGDTDACAALVELGRDADLLILECSTTDERKIAGHLTPTECGRIAAQARCRHLVLTHFYPVFEGYDIRRRVRRSYHGRLTLARDLASFSL